MTDLVYLNGDIIPAADARVSVFDAGFINAVGLFETLLVTNGHVLRIREHTQRLLDSAATLDIAVPATKEALEEATRALIGATEQKEARVRITVTPGQVPRQNTEPSGPTILITTDDVRRYPAELYQQGMRVCICPYKQNRYDPVAGHKTLAYLPRLISMKHAADRKCHEALWFTTDNHLAEGSICNVFLLHDGKLKTPPLDTPVLPGVTRKAVLEIAGECGIETSECVIDIETLLAAEEVFLTGSVLRLMPVTAIERHEVGKGVPGETTRMLATRYDELIAKECGGNG